MAHWQITVIRVGLAGILMSIILLGGWGTDKVGSRSPQMSSDKAFQVPSAAPGSSLRGVIRAEEEGGGHH